MTGFSKTVRELVRERSRGWCERCGGEPAIHWHHRRPRGMGSTKRPESNQPANCLHLCRDCHSHIELHREQAVAAGWLVPQHRTRPAEIPVSYRGKWALLTDGGEVVLISALSRLGVSD